MRPLALFFSRAGRVPVLLVAGLLATAASAGADTLYFPNGRTMSVKACRVDGAVMTVTLRGGGEATFDASMVTRVAPSEVPDPVDSPEPTPVSADAAPTTAAGVGIPIPSGPRPYASLIETVAGKHGVPAGLVHAVVQAESNYQARARSAAGARGLMQVMPRTGADFGVRNLYDPEANLEAGVRYLKSLMGEFALGQALAAYNAGPAIVRKYGGIPPYPETQDYVRRVLANLPLRP